MSRKILFGIGLASTSILLAAGLIWVHPRIFPTMARVEPRAAAPGERVTIHGSGFGPMSRTSQVLVDGSALTDKAIISWTGSLIEFFMPATLDSGLVAVRTRLGTSRSEGLVAVAKVPRQPDRSEASIRGPSILETKPAAAEAGSLVRIEGLNFGVGGQGYQVRFARSASENSGSLPGDVEHWDDTSISVYLPDGSGSGAFSVLTPTGRSIPGFIRVEPRKASRQLVDPVTYSITERVNVTGIRTATGQGRVPGAAELCLWVPDIPDVAAQERLQELGKSAEPFIASLGGASLYRWPDLADRSIIEFNSSRLVRVHETEIVFSPTASFPSSAPLPDFLNAHVQADPFIPSDRKEIRDRATRIAGTLKDQRKKAQAVWAWVVKNLKWSRGGKGGDVLAAIRAGSADSRTLALAVVALLRAAGLPAQVVSGALIDSDGTQIPHFWAEYHLTGVGWVPFDAVLGSGAHPGGFKAGFEDPSRYHGALDNRHVAVSRGFLALTPLLSDGAKRTARAQWSMQSLFEEARGLDSWASEWLEPEIRRVY